MNKIIPLFVILALFSFSSIAQGWSVLGTGTHALNPIGEGIYTICPDNRGNIYAAGWINDTSWHTLVAKWDGTNWVHIGTGSVLLDSFLNITQILPDTNGNIYVVGQYNNSTHQFVAKWDGTSWDKLGTGADALNANSQILTICIDKMGNLYAAGIFTDGITGTSGYMYVAKWNGASWSELGTGIHALKANNAINTLFADTAGNIYAAGAFTDSSKSYGGHIYVAKWNGTDWAKIGNGVSPQHSGSAEIFSIIVDNTGSVYAAGRFDSGNNVAKWDGIIWNSLESGIFFNCVFTICEDKIGNLYAGGASIDSLGFYQVSKWDGTTWSTFGTGSNALNGNNYISSICTDAFGNIYAAGEFTDTSTTLVYDSTTYHPYYVAKYSLTTNISQLQSLTGIKVYPDPAKNFLNIDISYSNRDLSGSTYVLYGASGKISKTGLLENNQTLINLSDLPPGLYLLQVGNPALGVYKVLKE